MPDVFFLASRRITISFPKILAGAVALSALAFASYLGNPDTYREPLQSLTHAAERLSTRHVSAGGG